jgi:hypothetical protein
MYVDRVPRLTTGEMKGNTVMNYQVHENNNNNNCNLQVFADPVDLLYPFMYYYLSKCPFRSVEIIFEETPTTYVISASHSKKFSSLIGPAIIPSGGFRVSSETCTN